MCVGARSVGRCPPIVISGWVTQIATPILNGPNDQVVAMTHEMLGDVRAAIKTTGAGGGLNR